MNITVGDSVSVNGATGWVLTGNFQMSGGFAASGSVTGSYWEAGGFNGITLVFVVSGGDNFFLFGTLTGGQLIGEWDRSFDIEGTFTLSR